MEYDDKYLETYAPKSNNTCISMAVKAEKL